MAEANSERVVTLSQLREQYGVPFSRVHLWRLERDQKFPARVRLSERRIVWRANEIESYLARCAADRPHQATA